MGGEASWAKKNRLVFGGFMDITNEHVYACGKDFVVLESFICLGGVVV